MGSVVKILPHYTYEDLKGWQDRWELIDGIPYAMSPLPRLKHQEVCGNIYSEFKQALKKGNCHCMAFLPLDYKVREDTILQPDMLVVCNPDINASTLTKTPILVAEVLSPSTALKDRNTKFYIYESEKVKYYLIVDIDAKAIELYQIGEDEKYKLINADFSQPCIFDFEGECSSSVTLANIWQ